MPITVLAEDPVKKINDILQKGVTSQDIRTKISELLKLNGQLNETDTSIKLIISGFITQLENLEKGYLEKKVDLRVGWRLIQSDIISQLNQLDNLKNSDKNPPPRSQSQNPFLSKKQSPPSAYESISDYFEDLRQSSLKAVDEWKINENQRASIKNKLLSLINSLEEGLLGSTNPNSFYGKDILNYTPSWIEQKLEELETLKNGLGIDQQSWLGELKNFLKHKFMMLTAAQRAIDGLNLAVKHRLFGKKIGQLDFFKAHFTGISLEENYINALYNRDSDEQNFNAAVSAVFVKLKNNIFAKLVIDSNYGENASVLDLLLYEMARTDYSSLDSISKLESFFKLSASSAYFKTIWGEFNSNYSHLASRMLNEQLDLSTGKRSLLSVVRDKHDTATILSFLYAYDKAKFMKELSNPYRGKKSNPGEDKLRIEIENQNSIIKDLENQIKDGVDVGQALDEAQNKLYQLQRQLSSLQKGLSEADQLFSIVTGLDFSFPPTVACTIMQNHKTLQTLYDNFKFNFDEYLDMVSGISLKVSTIYNLKFGTKFHSSISPSTRAHAAYTFMEKLSKLPDARVLDNLISKLINTNYSSDQPNDPNSKITLRNLDQYLFDAVVPLDYLNISRVRYYEAEKDFYNNLRGTYDIVLQEFNSSPPPINISRPDTRSGQNLSRVYLPDLYANFVNATFSSLFPEFGDFRARRLYGRSEFSGRYDESFYTGQLVDIDLIGDGNSRVRGAFQRQETETSSSNSVSSRLNLDAYNFGIFGSQLYKTVAELINNNYDIINSSGNVLQTSKNWIFNQRLQAISPADLQIITDFSTLDQEWMDKNNDPGIIQKKLDLHTTVLLRTDSGWTRVALDQVKVNKEGRLLSLQDIINEEVGRIFVANRSIWSGKFATEQAVEYQSGGRVGMLFGFENTTYDNRFASLYAKTPSGNQALMAAYGFDNSAKNPKLVTFGYVDISKPEEDWKRKGRDTRLRQYSYEQRGWPGMQSYPPGDKAFVASYQVVDKLYGLIAVGGSRFGLKGEGVVGRDEEGKADKYASGNLLLHYDQTGVHRWQASVGYSSSNFAVDGFVDVSKRSEDYGGLVTRIKIGKDKYITITGARLPPIDQSMSTDFDKFISEVNSLSGDMESAIKNTSSDADKRRLTREYAERVINIMNQFYAFRNLDFIRDQRTDFSIAIESPDWKGKIGISQIGENNGNFLMGMVDVSNAFSFTGGISLNGQSELKNFAGLKIKDENVVYMFSTYNASVPGKLQSYQASVSKLFDDGWVGKINLTGHADKSKLAGWSGEVFVGNRKYNFTLGSSNINGIQDFRVAGELILKEIAYLSAVGLSYRQLHAPAGFAGNELNAYAQLFKRNLTLNAYYNRYTYEKTVYDYGFKLTIHIEF